MPYDAYAEILKQGNLVAFPTETVYGLGASAWNPAAIRKVFEIKGRPIDNPLIVHVSSVDMVKHFAHEVSPRAKNLMQKFWPGPLTLVFNKKPEVLDVITAGLNTVAIRMPDHQLALDLINQAGPLVAPSANKSGRPSPTRAEHVITDFGKRIPVLDGGECQIGLESTVLDVTTNPPVILRPGFITAARIHDLCGFRPNQHTGMQVKPDEKVQSPGMKYSHYAPEARIDWMDLSIRQEQPDTLFLMHTRRILPAYSSRLIHFNGNFERMARELYDWFRKADYENLNRIVIEPFPDELRTSNELINALENRISKAISR